MTGNSIGISYTNGDEINLITLNVVVIMSFIH